MKITPLEIRQKTFEKNFRGYDKDEVSGYLQSLSQEWERLQDENKELSIKLTSAEREVEKLREVENSLFKTLKTAEDTGANIMDQATKAAELHMKETELKAEAILNDARTKARDTMEEAELHAKDVYDELEAQVKSLSKLYHTLENMRDDLLSDIKGLTSEINEKVTRARKQVKEIDIDEQVMEIRKASMQYKGPKKKKLEEAEKESIPKLPEPSDHDDHDDKPGPVVKRNTEIKSVQSKEEDLKPEEVKSKEEKQKKKKKKEEAEVVEGRSESGENGEKSFFDEID